MADDTVRPRTPSRPGTIARPPSAQSSKSKSVANPSSSVPKSQDELRAYIPSIPNECSADELEQQIRTRIKRVTGVQVNDVKCYLNLGVAMIEATNESDRQRLVNEVESIVLDPENGTMIRFVPKLDLNSYLVVDRTVSKVPSPEALAARLMDVYKTTEIRSCQPIPVQFPNIFSIQFADIDEIARVSASPIVKINSTLVTVYVRANCSFFEDVPADMTQEKLWSLVSPYFDEKLSTSTSSYLQYDRETSSAVVLASLSNKNWMKQSFLEINGRQIQKKVKLAYRVVVHPVPQGFDINLILNHDLFADKHIRHSHIEDRLIVELKDSKAYEKCLHHGALRIEKHTMGIDKHGLATNPDDAEVDASNWYETEMLDIEPNIVPIMSNYQHPIFRYKWNPEIWLEQLHKLESVDRRSKKYDRDRHLLRVTVMLHTIGVLRKKAYTIGDQVITLNLQRLQTIGYDHASKLSFGRTIPVAEFKTPYPSTSISVCNEDCLILYESMMKDGYRPVLLNMANATIPGGGYRKGDGAQEENLFRRSNYYQSLDLEIADKEASDTLICTSKCKTDKKKGYQGLYPMEKFGAIYTSGITVFRGTEAKGYPYLKTPLHNVCSIAMAAYREPKLTKNNMLENKFAIETRKKIENVFAIAHHQKHDCLVLSALGCGAFKNPPEHVAKLFKSVIYQYAGYFKKIVFAIIDDHNTGNHINPRGNFIPFRELLDGLVVCPAKEIYASGASGPYCILNKSSDDKVTLSDACIQHCPPCHHGTQCRDINDPKHSADFCHPPRCLYQPRNASCDQMNDEVHTFTFNHRMKCKFGGECNNTDQNHLNDYDHPDFCENKLGCMDTDSKHLRAYRHLPLCRDGIDCSHYRRKTPEHLNAFRHCKTICPSDNCCPQFHNEQHTEKTIHSFRKPCPFTPYDCSLFRDYIQANGKKPSDDVERHCFTYSHVCQFGRLCRTSDELHYETSIHIPRQLCPDSSSCSKITDETHLQSFSHEGIRDIRLVCKFPGYKCKDRWESKHTKIYRHVDDFDHLSVAPSQELNDGIDFYRNQGRIIKRVNEYVDRCNWEKPKSLDDILSWIRALQPVHRCRADIFESILVHGHVMSRHYMNELSKPRCVVNAVMQHSTVRMVLFKHNSGKVKEHTNELIALLVRNEFLKAGSAEVPALEADHDEKVNTLLKILSSSLNQNDLALIQDQVAKIVRASIDLSKHLAGIGFGVDKILGTHKHVFSILGPHCGTYYGDIVIVFKKELMFHPDANFSFQAATGFHSGRVYNYRPWWIDPKEEDKRVLDFHHAKLHCSFPRYEYAAAAELVASTGQNKNTMDVPLQNILEQWKQHDSHYVFEGHLPPLIPLDYVETVYIPRNMFFALAPEAQKAAKEIFKDSLVIAAYDVNLSLIKPGGTVPLDSTRKPYFNYIFDTICQKIEENMKTSHILRGFVVTIPATELNKHMILPITISQSHELYCLNKSRAVAPIQSTYIYWQAKHGDMMLTLLNEKIDQKAKSQTTLHGLVCYLAERPSTVRREYHEEYSYLNSGSPFDHFHNVSKANFKASSSRFYRGCNAEDFFTFCLRITYTTGEVSLTHAGPNGIYNCENIRYQFSKSELDLSKLNYIYISAGNEDIPVRNFSINHEPIAELHPCIDKDFKLNTSIILRQRRSSMVHTVVVCKNPKGDGDTTDDGSKSSMKRSSSAADLRAKEPEPPAPTPVHERSFFSRLKYLVFGPTQRPAPPLPQPKKETLDSNLEKEPKSHASEENSSKCESDPKSKDSRAYSSEQGSSQCGSMSPQRDNHSKPKPIPAAPMPLISSSLPPCRDSIYCLKQNSKDHTDAYSHICRFNHLCRKQATEPHLVHKHHNIPACSEDKNCSQRTNPIHRSEFRHSGLPDYLIPCRYQDACEDTSSEHRIRYFHGEEIPSIKKTSKSSDPSHPRLIPCKYGNECRNKRDPQHTAKYSHPPS